MAGRWATPTDFVAAGAYGQGDECAPSRLSIRAYFSSGLDITLGYEEMFIATMVARGFAVVVTDYEGLGTTGVHTFANRLAQAQAVLDAAVPPAAADYVSGPMGRWRSGDTPGRWGGG